jgi:hypothetical protein
MPARTEASRGGSIRNGGCCCSGRSCQRCIIGGCHQGTSGAPPATAAGSHDRRRPHRCARQEQRACPSSKKLASSPGLPQALALLLVALCMCTSLATANTATATVPPFGYQTSSASLLTGSTYAASAAYDPITSTLYVVGASYEASYRSDEADGLIGGDAGGSAGGGSTGSAGGQVVVPPPRPSDCYLTALALPGNPSGASGVLVKRLGEPGIAEACTDVSLLDATYSAESIEADGDGGDGYSVVGADGDGGGAGDGGGGDVTTTKGSSHLLVLGHTAPRGLLTDLRPPGSDRSATYGFGLDLTVSASITKAAIEDDAAGEAESGGGGTGGGGSIAFSANLLGGRLFQENIVTYPVATTVPPRSFGDLDDGRRQEDGYFADGGPKFAYLLLHYR